MRGPELLNPTIDQILPGMMCRCRPKDWGIIIRDVNVSDKLVLVGDSIGGRKESYVWIPVSRVRLVWSIGTYEEAMQLIEAFNGEMDRRHKVKAIPAN